jgi:putative acetyltransferase
MVQKSIVHNKLTLGYDFAVVLGDPAYYTRFGFVPARHFGIRCEYDVPEDAFMVMELQPDALRNQSGLIRYRKEFSEVE